MTNTPLTGSPTKVAVGYYTATYKAPGGSAVDLGLVQDVRRLRQRYSAQPVMADKYGDSMIDGVYRGTDIFMFMIFKEWTATTKQALWPFSATWGIQGLAGRLLTSLAGELVLTSTAGVSAGDTTGPETITAPYAILAPQQDTEILFGNLVRDVPVLFQLLPYTDGTNVMHFATTEPS